MDGIQNVAASVGGVHGTLALGAIGPQPWMVSHVQELLQTRHPAVALRTREIQATAPLTELRAGALEPLHPRAAGSDAVAA